MVAEHADLERALADPDLHADQDRARALGRRYAELGRVVAASSALASAADDLEAGREMALEDPAFADEVPALEVALEDATEHLREVLVPADPDDGSDVILEVKAGEGGEESALFAGDLLRMYLRHAERVGWRTQLLSATASDLGGYKDVVLSVKGARGPDADGPWARLKHEGGVHRVQRVPVTESAGRVHTSAVGVLVTPEVDEVEVSIDASELRVDVFRSSGPGGQSVNTTDSAVRITHLPTGTVVSCQNEKSQLQNREQALRILRSRLHAAAKAEADASAAAARRSQVRTVDRSERIRTYNYPENRVADHRTGYKSHSLETVLDGDMGALIQSSVDADRAARLAEAAGGS